MHLINTILLIIIEWSIQASALSPRRGDISKFKRAHSGVAGLSSKRTTATEVDDTSWGVELKYQEVP